MRERERERERKLAPRGSSFPLRAIIIITTHQNNTNNTSWKEASASVACACLFFLPFPPLSLLHSDSEKRHLRPKYPNRSPLERKKQRLSEKKHNPSPTSKKKKLRALSLVEREQSPLFSKAEGKESNEYAFFAREFELEQIATNSRALERARISFFF
jgi:hypothetical protein